MIDRATLEAKRAEYQRTIDDYQRSIYALQGAIQAIDELEALLDPALTIDQLGQALGAVEIGEPQEVQA